MPHTPERGRAAGHATREEFRHLPEVIALEDTVASVPTDLPLEDAGERNSFIAAAVNAGG